MKFENANVLINGGASGIGKMMGRMALEKGAKCFIIEKDYETELNSVVDWVDGEVEKRS